MIRKGGYIIIDGSDLVLDGVENTKTGVYKRFKNAYDLKKNIVITDLTLKKALTGLTADVKVETANASLIIANNVLVLTTLVGSMNININIASTDKYKGIKF